MLNAIFIMLTLLTLLKAVEVGSRLRELPPREIRKEQREVKNAKIKEDLAQKKERERERSLMRKVNSYDGNVR